MLAHLGSSVTCRSFVVGSQSRCKGLINNPEQLYSAIQLITKVTAKSLACRLLQGGAHGAVDPIRLTMAGPCLLTSSF